MLLEHSIDIIRMGEAERIAGCSCIVLTRKILGCRKLGTEVKLIICHRKKSLTYKFDLILHLPKPISHLAMCYYYYLNTYFENSQLQL